MKNNPAFGTAFVKILCALLLFWSSTAYAQTTVRPMIWVKPDDKALILNKIATQPWAKDYYEGFKARTDTDIKSHQADVKAFLSKMPLDWAKQTAGQLPPFIAMKVVSQYRQERGELMHYIRTGIDASILYFLTDDERYAQCSADILHTVITGLVQLKPSEEGHNGGGLLYPDDHLREAREIGSAVPILYDFVYPFLAKGGQVFDVAQGRKVPFSEQNAEKVFKTYIQLALEHGIVDCNWPILESPSLVGNTLALNSEAERNEFLTYYLTKNTPHQDALLKVGKFYETHGGNWPESTNYSGAVAELSTYLMALLTKYDPSLHLGKTYPQIPLALTTTYYLTYPNRNEMVLFGDGHRDYHTDYDAFETAYYLGQLDNSDVLKKEFGALINSGLASKQYRRPVVEATNRTGEVYKQPVELLWFSPTIEGAVQDYPLPTTDELPFAGIVVQRNLSTTNNEKDALMGFVGGASFVHGHASGMNLELYGRGQVLGSKAGRGTYVTDLHENYYRLFAGHNTVIVNGVSEGSGGWANLGMNRVETVALEPAVRKQPVSPNHSFSTSRFVDDKGDKAEATQERTLAIVRTSPTTGYYVDIFRSKSALPNQFHDYVYHNVGDRLSFNAKGAKFQLHPDPERYQASAAKPWKNNRTARHPGWHFFSDVETSGPFSGPVDALFTANKLGPTPITMKLFIPGHAQREYTSVMAPPTSEAPKPYDKLPNPTLVMRQTGDAWANPFAVVYEPVEGTGTVQSVETITQNGVFKGLKVKSIVDGKPMTQLVLSLEKDDAQFTDAKLGLSFTGRYAVAALSDKNRLQSVYMGSGQSFSYNKVRIATQTGQSTQAYVSLEAKTPTATTGAALTIQLASGKKLTIPASQ